MSSENQHVVQRNESLWSIANRIATQTNQPIAQVMQQIKAQNSHAFIQGDVNRLRQGLHLTYLRQSIKYKKPLPSKLRRIRLKHQDEQNIASIRLK